MNWLKSFALKKHYRFVKPFLGIFEVGWTLTWNKELFNWVVNEDPVRHHYGEREIIGMLNEGYIVENN